MCIRTAAIVAFALFSVPALRAQSVPSESEFLLRQVVPLSHYVAISPFKGSANVHEPQSLEKTDLRKLEIVFNRDSLPQNAGPQFIRILTTVTNRDGSLYDKVTQFALTFPRGKTEVEDNVVLKKIADEVILYGFISKRKIDTVSIELDSIPDWALIKIEIRPDEDFTKYTSRVETKLEFYFRAKGGRFESSFFLGIPKVLFDSNRNDTINYGNVSAMLRFYILDDETGVRFPVNVGIGTFGVNTPIDVSRSGGGFAFSILFDIVEMIRSMHVDITPRLNAGIEITPFFPVEREARLLLNARIGYSP